MPEMTSGTAPPSNEADHRVRAITDTELDDFAATVDDPLVMVGVVGIVNQHDYVRASHRSFTDGVEDVLTIACRGSLTVPRDQDDLHQSGTLTLSLVAR